MQRTAAGHRTVKDHNAGLVLELVARASRDPTTRGVSRAQLAITAGLSRATAGDIVDRLVTAGLVLELEPERGARGRPGSPVRLDPGGATGLGAEINVDYVAVCALDLTGAVLDTDAVPVDNRDRAPGPTLAHAGDVVNALVRRLPGCGPVAGITLAVPGLVDTDGRVRRAPNLTAWHEVAAGPALHRHLGPWADGLEVQVDNEANLAAQAQLWFGTMHPDLRDFVYVTGEVGIGAGIVLDGSVFRGVRGYAGELGHVVVEPDGPRCHCGGFGCLEQVAGQDALLRNAGLQPRTDTVERLAELASAGQSQALRALEQAGRALGQALAGTSNLFDVPVVVLGGSYGRLARWLSEPIQTQLDRQVTSRPWAATRLIVSDLDRDAAVRGAAGQVLARVIARPRFG